MPKLFAWNLLGHKATNKFFLPKHAAVKRVITVFWNDRRISCSLRLLKDDEGKKRLGILLPSIPKKRDVIIALCEMDR